MMLVVLQMRIHTTCTTAPAPIACAACMRTNSLRYVLMTELSEVEHAHQSYVQLASTIRRIAGT